MIGKLRRTTANHTAPIGSICLFANHDSIRIRPTLLQSPYSISVVDVFVKVGVFLGRSHLWQSRIFWLKVGYSHKIQLCSLSFRRAQQYRSAMKRMWGFLVDAFAKFDCVLFFHPTYFTLIQDRLRSMRREVHCFTELTFKPWK